MNPHWSRWVFASLSKYFSDGKGDVANFHVQGTLRKLADDIERAEFRWTGLDYQQNTRGQYRVSCIISILITVPIGKDNHRINNLTGRFAKLNEGSIPIKKYGDTVDDDGSQIGCLQLQGKVRTHEWGQIVPDVKVTQSSIEADFIMDLQET